MAPKRKSTSNPQPRAKKAKASAAKPATPTPTLATAVLSTRPPSVFETAFKQNVNNPHLYEQFTSSLENLPSDVVLTNATNQIRQANEQALHHVDLNPLANQSLSSSSASAPTDSSQMAISFDGRLVRQSSIKVVAPPPTSGHKVRTEYNLWLKDPTKFQMIHESLQLPAVDWSWKKAREHLIKTYPTLGFERLSESTMSNWFYNKGTAKLPHYVPKPETLRSLQQRRTRPFGSGRQKLIRRCEKAVRMSIRTIDAMRAAKQPVNSLTALPIVTAIFTVHASKEVVRSLNIDQRFVRRFLQNYCGFSYRRVTSASKTIPTNAEEQISRFVDRCGALVHTYKIRPELIINFDQSGIKYVPASSYTYEQIGAERAAVDGHDDKRQFTIVVSSTLNGELLPLQVILEGKSELSLPRPSKLGHAWTEKLKDSGWHLTFSDNHWSNQQTMVQFIEQIVVKYWEKVRLKPTENVLIILDGWSVHTSKEFRAFMEKYPQFHLAYLPPNTTAISQPADISLQRPLKLSFRKSFDAYCTDAFYKAALSAHASNVVFDPTAVDVDTRLSAIKHLVVQWLYDAHQSLAQSHACLAKGWERYSVMKDAVKCEQIYDKLTDASNPAFTRVTELASVLADVSEHTDEGRLSGTDRDEMDEQNGLHDQQYADADDDVQIETE